MGQLFCICIGKNWMPLYGERGNCTIYTLIINFGIKSHGDLLETGCQILPVMFPEE